MRRLDAQLFCSCWLAAFLTPQFPKTGNRYTESGYSLPGSRETTVGKGYRHSEFAGFCVPTEEAQARFDESLAVILKAWSSDEPFSHEGRFWHYHEIVVEPPTAQKPHPPVKAVATEEVCDPYADAKDLLVGRVGRVRVLGSSAI
jgi:Luciferase-like monooxygenase